MSRESTPEITDDLPMTNFTLFCNGEGDTMHFLVQLRDKNEERRVCDVILDHVGAVSTDRNDFGPHTAVLVDDNVLSFGHHRDAFKVSYINECIKNGIILDISKFLKGKSIEFTEDFNFMNIVYFKNHTWDSVPDKYKLKSKLLDSGSSRTSSLNQSPERKPQKRKGEPYTRKEKEAILKFIMKRYSIAGESTLKGRHLWQRLERANVCDRTWQSMKEHFLKILVKELSSFSFLSRQDIQNIHNALK